MSTKDEPEAFDLGLSPSHLLHRAQQFAAERFADAMAEEQLTQRQFAVLSAVAANEGLTQTDLVRATGIDRSTLAELVGRMARRGQLVRERARTDARANTVRLSDEGRRLLDYALPRVRDADEAILAVLGKARRSGFADILQRIAAAMDGPPPEEIAKAKVIEKKKKKTAKKRKEAAEAPKDTKAKKRAKAAKPEKAAAKSEAKTDGKKAKKAGKNS